MEYHKNSTKTLKLLTPTPLLKLTAQMAKQKQSPTKTKLNYGPNQIAEVKLAAEIIIDNISIEKNEKILSQELKRSKCKNNHL